MRRALVGLLLLCGCALFTRSPPLDIRRFSPERPRPPVEQRPEPKVATLKLGQVTANAELGRRILRRTSEVELDRYDELWWTETPDAFVRRSLSRALFDERPLQEGVSGPGPSLEVEVLAFEESAPGVGRVQLRYRLIDNRAVLDRGEVVRERQASGKDFSATAVAIGEAMDSATAEIADAVLHALAPPKRLTRQQIGLSGAVAVPR
jgi:cholesterol transport system auxiliary component